ERSAGGRARGGGRAAAPAPGDPRRGRGGRGVMDTGGLAALSVRRPVLIAVANLLIVLVGLAAALDVSVRELPDVDRPIVTVRAMLPGGSPETMDAQVTRILEGGVARVPGVKHIRSSSEETFSRVRIEFDSAVDINAAASDVREAVSQVQGNLPEEIDQLLVIKADDDAMPIIELAVYSDRLTREELARRVEKDVAPVLRAIRGVAGVRVEGNRPRELRVLLDPARMAGYRISIAEVIDVIRNARFDIPAGSYESEDQELIVRAYATVVEP